MCLLICKYINTNNQWKKHFTIYTHVFVNDDNIFILEIIFFFYFCTAFRKCVDMITRNLCKILELQIGKKRRLMDGSSIHKWIWIKNRHRLINIYIYFWVIVLIWIYPCRGHCRILIHFLSFICSFVHNFVC